MKKITLAALTGLVLSSLASASIIPSLAGITGVAGGYQWTYTATLSADQRLDPAATAMATCAGGQLCSPPGLTPASGTFFTIYDVAGYNGVTTTPSNWHTYSMLVGATPGNITATDNNMVANVSFFYNGPVVPTPGTPKPAPGPTNLGNFVIGSTLGSQAIGFYTGQATKNVNDITDGTLTTNSGNVPVPGGVPEPTSMVLLGSGLAGLAFFRRKLSRG